MRDPVLGLPTSPADIEDQVRIPHGVLTSFYDGIVADGYLARADGRLELADWAVRTDHAAYRPRTGCGPLASVS
jgi:hypothetical protein